MTNYEINFKPLTPQQIEVRPTNTKFKGSANLLLYIDSRCAANILNDTVGVFNWQIEYKSVNDKVYGRLSIRHPETGEWVIKEDTGSESNIEADKGQASDILKRCIARWGCDFLYTAPDIKIKCPDNYYFNDKLTMTFTVKDIEYVDKRICRLVIVDRFGNEVYKWSETGKTPAYAPEVETTPTTTTTTNTKEVPESPVSNLDALTFFCKQEKTEENKDQLTRFYNYYKPKCDTWKGVMNHIQLWENWQKPRTN